MRDVVPMPNNDQQKSAGDPTAVMQAWRQWLHVISGFFRQHAGGFAPLMGDAGKTLADVEAKVIHETKQAARVTDDYVRANPWRAIGIAAVVAMMIGAMVKRK